VGPAEHGTSINELLDRAVQAINRGDRAAADALAGQVLAADHGNEEAEDLLAAPKNAGEIRRLTILVADLVDSTSLSSRVEPEIYRTVVGRYREFVQQTVDRYEGHIASTKGDGLLAVFGHPRAHDNDVRRGVVAATEICDQVAELSRETQRKFGFEVSVRVGVHRGVVYLDIEQDDVYGLAANVAARLNSLALPGSVVVSDAVAALVDDVFELTALPPAMVAGIDEPLSHHRVLGEKPQAARSRPGHTPLVGRDRELARLKKSWARAEQGTLSTPGVVFRGEAGIGKSRLVAAATELAAESDAATVELIGSPFHTDVGLHPVRTMLERRCGISHSTDQSERLRLLTSEVQAQSLDIHVAVPLLAPVLGVGAEHGYTPAAAEGRKLYELIAQAVSEYLLAVIGGGPALVVADDVQWFDASTIEILGALLQKSDGRRLIVIAGRPGDWLPPTWPVKLFDLAPLTDDQADELILALDPTLEPAERAAVKARCDGIPFFLEQVVGEVTDAGVPEALYDPLFARLRASANVVPVVEAAGVIGRHVNRAILAAVCGLDDDELDDVIDVLEDALVLESAGIDSWRFRHELLREVAYELAPPSVRRDFHRKVADALIDAVSGDPDWRLVAGHYERAMDFDRAASAYQHASEAARRRGALAEGRAYLSLAIAQLSRAAPGPERDQREIAARLQRGLLAGAAEGHSSEEAAADFERCLYLGGTDVADDRLAATLAALMGYYTVRADLHRATAVGDMLRSGLRPDRQWFRPSVEAICGVVQVLRADLPAAHRHLTAATADRAAAEDDNQLDKVWFLPNDPTASAHINLAVVHMLRGDLVAADEELANAERRAAGLGFPQGPYSLGYARFVATWIRIEAGQLHRAAASAADLLELAERHGFDQWRMVGAIQQSTIAALSVINAERPNRSELSAHLATIADLTDMMLKLGLAIYGTSFAAHLARLLIAVGQTAQAREHLDLALALADATGMAFYNAELVRLRALTLPDEQERLAEIAKSAELARAHGATLFELRATIDDFELRGEAAYAALADVLARSPHGWPEYQRAQALLANSGYSAK
jgi:class 3 adenylate cyclase